MRLPLRSWGLFFGGGDSFDGVFSCDCPCSFCSSFWSSGVLRKYVPITK